MSPAGEGCSGVDWVEGVLLPVSCVCVWAFVCVCAWVCDPTDSTGCVWNWASVSSTVASIIHLPSLCSYLLVSLHLSLWEVMVVFFSGFFFFVFESGFNLFEILCSTPISPNRHSCKREKIVFFIFHTPFCMQQSSFCLYFCVFYMVNISSCVYCVFRHEWIGIFSYRGPFLPQRHKIGKNTHDVSRSRDKKQD